jgi:hypothetical protein
MNQRTTIHEKRREKRYQACDGAFAALRNNTTKLGQIMDISRKGLSLRYIDIGERPEESVEMDIFMSGNGFFLKQISFRTVFDLELDTRLEFSSIPMRRRGVEFVNLNPQQFKSLIYFIENHTL